MTTLIIVLFAVITLNMIHHLTVIEQLKAVKQNQFDIIEHLDYIDDDMAIIYDELKNIKRSIEDNQ